MHVLGRVEQLHGKPLSFNNLNDLSAARLLATRARRAGVRDRQAREPVRRRGGGDDRGGVREGPRRRPRLRLRRRRRAVPPGDGRAGRAVLADQFVEVLFAPGYDAVAVEALVQKPGVRILNDQERRAFEPTEWDLKRVMGGVLVQERDLEPDPLDGMEVVCGEVETDVWDDLLFAWTVVKHTLSNAIVIARGGQTLGIGAGQMSRVDAVRIAVEKAGEHRHSLEGASLASDAFFPFPDGPALAIEAGVSAIIQPGGSKRDDEVVAAVRDADATMVFAGRRHFRH